MVRRDRKRTSAIKDKAKSKKEKADNSVEEEVDATSASGSGNEESGENVGNKSKQRNTSLKDNQKKKSKTSVEESDQSNESSAESESDDEPLSQLTKQSKTSKTKDKQKRPKKKKANDKKHLVAAILKHREHHNQHKYLIKWADDSREPTWESLQKTVAYCPDMLRDYNTANEAEAIIDHKKTAHCMKYLIKWKDTSKGETWETFRTVSKTCPKMLKTYTEETERFEAKAYGVTSIIKCKHDKSSSKYLLKWNDKCRGKTWETAKTVMKVCPELLDSFVKKNPDGAPVIQVRYRYRSRSPQPIKKKSLVRAKDLVEEEFDENVEWEVERIRDVWIKKNKTREFLIHWKGWRSKYDSWEAEENINCPDLIAEFMAEIEKAKSALPKELRPQRKQTDRLVDRTKMKPKYCANRYSKRNDSLPRAVYFDADD